MSFVYYWLYMLVQLDKLVLGKRAHILTNFMVLSYIQSHYLLLLLLQLQRCLDYIFFYRWNLLVPPRDIVLILLVVVTELHIYARYIDTMRVCTMESVKHTPSADGISNTKAACVVILKTSTEVFGQKPDNLTQLKVHKAPYLIIFRYPYHFQTSQLRLTLQHITILLTRILLARKKHQRVNYSLIPMLPKYCHTKLCLMCVYYVLYFLTEAI